MTERDEDTTLLIEHLDLGIRLARAAGVSFEEYFCTQHRHAPLGIDERSRAIMYGYALLRWFELEKVS